MQFKREPLAEWIQSRIEAMGPVTLAQFISWALYHQEHGYYTRGPAIGPRGDFTTSPEASPAFGRLLANHVADVDLLLDSPSQFNIIECGPGRGTLAYDLLAALQKERPNLYARTRYWLVEVSPALKQSQMRLLQPEHGGKVTWAGSLSELSARLDGVIIGNEFVDAFPVNVLQNSGGALKERYVGLTRAGDFKIVPGEVSDARLLDFVGRYGLDLAPGESLEVNLGVADWLRDSANTLARGVVTLIDYGDRQPARYSAARRQGTLLGYYGGSVTRHILEHPGEQDLTALVDFTALSDQAVEAGFSVLSLTRQAAFLVGLGLGTSVTLDAAGSEVQALLAYRRGLQALISMEGLGKFHVLVLGKSLEAGHARRGLSGLKYEGLL